MLRQIIVFILKKLDVFIMNNKLNKDGKHVCTKIFICNRYLHSFSSKERGDNHFKNGCDMFEPIRTE
jgi:hypothetical protein